MRGITFNNLPSIRPAEPGRMDVACMIGFAPLAWTPLFSDTLKQWLIERGWDKLKVDQLDDHPEWIRNTPVPLESWDAFCAVFSDHRLDRQGILKSRTLADPLPIDQADRVLHVIVDHTPIPVPLTTDAQGRIALDDLADQLNAKFAGQGALALIDSSSRPHLIIQRTDGVAQGELTIHANKSLGFPQAVQSDAHEMPHYTGAAIKAFFGHGGNKCYFICMGDPLPYHAADLDRCRQLYTLIWGRPKADAYFENRNAFERSDLLQMPFPAIPHGASPVSQWQGISHLAGLSDVTYVCFPDLVDILGDPKADAPQELSIADSETFVACSSAETAPDWYYSEVRKLPEYSAEMYAVWKRVLEQLLAYLSVRERTVQLVAGLPMPDLNLLRDFDDFVTDDILSETSTEATVYKHLQLAFPWLKTNRSGKLPSALEPPEGTLLGILAYQSRRIGAFRSIAGSLVENAYDLLPRQIDAYSTPEKTKPCLADRVSWFDFIPDGISLQSDVTAVLQGNDRYGAVRRIMILIQRAAYRIGLDHVFESSSEQIWRTIKARLTDLLHHIYLKNGLRGKSSKEAYAVSCGRSTMTQNDIDNGRLIANVTLRPAVPIGQIAVDVLVERDGAVSFGSDTV